MRMKRPRLERDARVGDPRRDLALEPLSSAPPAVMPDPQRPRRAARRKHAEPLKAMAKAGMATGRLTVSTIAGRIAGRRPRRETRASGACAPA